MRSRSTRAELCLLALAVVVVVAVVVAGCDGDTTGATRNAAVTSPEGGASLSGTSEEEPSATSETTSRPAPTPSTTGRAPVTITVLYDNTTAVPGLRPHWGFSCLIQGLDKTILFDTGARGDILLRNMELLGVTPRQIDVVVLSHDHSDHTGGLAQILADNPDLAVYYPVSFSRDSVAPARNAGASLVPVESTVSPCAGATVLAPFGKPQESGLLLETAAGRVLIVGCAHPGLVEMVAAAGDEAGAPVMAVLGGFHLASYSGGRVKRMTEELRAMGVERCGPAHCTGESAIAQLRAAFGSGAIVMGVGAVITF